MRTRRDGSPVLEASVEAHLEKRMKKIGGRAHKFPPAVKGAPDRIVVFPHGRIFFVELKREKTGRLSPAQELWHQRSLEMGHVVHVLDSREQVDAFIGWVLTQGTNDNRHKDLAAVRANYYAKEAT